MTNALKKADSKGFRERNRAESLKNVESVLFPLFGAGQAGADLEDAIDGLMRSARSYLERTLDSTIKRV